MSCNNLKALLEDSANAIRAKEGTTGKICGEDIPQRILNLQAGNGMITPTGTKTITQNGSEDVTSYASVNVNVPIPDGYVKPTGTKAITTNGEHTITEYEKVSVNVPTGTFVSGTKAITENGTHDVTSFASVNVNVPTEKTELSDIDILSVAVAPDLGGGSLSITIKDSRTGEERKYIKGVKEVCPSSSYITPDIIKDGENVLGEVGSLKVGNPISVYSEIEMDNIIQSATSEDIGKIYIYLGVTGTYENGAKYILSEVE